MADLRYISEGNHKIFQQIVRGGVLSELGMASFAERLSEDDVDAIHDYVIDTARKKWDEEQSSSWWKGFREWFHGVLAYLLNALGLL